MLLIADNSLYFNYITEFGGNSKILYKSPPPKVIHIRFGNLRIQEFYKVLDKMWTDIEENIKTHKLVNVYKDRIESVS